MSRQRLYDALLNLDYEDVIDSCRNNPDARTICKDPVFWEEKAQREYKTSLRQVESNDKLEPREKYLAILSQKDVKRGSEEFLNPQECLKRAVATGRTDLCEYFVEKGNIDVDEALIQAAGNKDLFDDLVKDYRKDIYADPDLYYLILLEAIRSKNFPLVREILPKGFDLIPEEADTDALLSAAATTGDYGFIDYIADYFDETEEETDQWLLQAALLGGDEDFAEDIITDMITNRQYRELAKIFVITGDNNRLNSLIQLTDFEETANIGKDILLDAVRYNRPVMVRLVAEDPVFQIERRRSWFEEALDLSRELDRSEITPYLTKLLRTM